MKRKGICRPYYFYKTGRNKLDRRCKKVVMTSASITWTFPRYSFILSTYLEHEKHRLLFKILTSNQFSEASWDNEKSEVKGSHRDILLNACILYEEIVVSDIFTFYDNWFLKFLTAGIKRVKEFYTLFNSLYNWCNLKILRFSSRIYFLITILSSRIS